MNACCDSKEEKCILHDVLMCLQWTGLPVLSCRRSQCTSLSPPHVPPMAHNEYWKLDFGSMNMARLILKMCATFWPARAPVLGYSTMVPCGCSIMASVVTLWFTLLSPCMRSSAVKALVGGGMYWEVMTWREGLETLEAWEGVQECENKGVGDDEWVKSREEAWDSVS